MKLAPKKRIVSRNVNKPESSFNTNLVLQWFSDKTNCFVGEKKDMPLMLSQIRILISEFAFLHAKKTTAVSKKHTQSFLWCAFANQAIVKTKGTGD